MFNFAIFITLSRIALTPIIIFFMVQNSWHLAFVVFMIAVCTDLLDGFVARRLQQESKFGQILDPIADKILLGTVMSAILVLHATTFLTKIFVSFLLCKELILLFGGAILWFGYKKFIPPSILSRTVSLCEIILIIAFFATTSDYCLTLQPFILWLMILNLALSSWLLLRYLKIVLK
jgi:CDP-diacylglycerol--glycerol-3-phosphate 3-phosphatidyltransferase